MAADLGDASRFRPYIQVHEFEALIFVSPELAGVRADDAKVAKTLAAAVQQAGGPELVNDNSNTAPSKRIETVWPGYVKTLDGVEIARQIG